MSLPPYAAASYRDIPLECKIANGLGLVATSAAIGGGMLLKDRPERIQMI